MKTTMIPFTYQKENFAITSVTYHHTLVLFFCDVDAGLALLWLVFLLSQHLGIGFFSVVSLLQLELQAYVEFEFPSVVQIPW